MLDTFIWQRNTAGNSYQFDATEEVIVNVLKLNLPESYGPYSLIGTYKKKVGKAYEDAFEEIDIDLDAFLKLREKNIWQFFIKSQFLSNDLNLSGIKYIDSALATNGLINLQCSSVVRGEATRPSVGLVGSVANTKTNEVIKHVEYKEIFNKLKRAFVKLQKTGENVK